MSRKVAKALSASDRGLMLRVAAGGYPHNDRERAKLRRLLKDRYLYDVWAHIYISDKGVQALKRGLPRTRRSR